MHYDGQLKLISEDIAALDFDGIDSFTEPPEGDMSVIEARNAWPDKFIWQNINLSRYEMPQERLKENLFRTINAAGHKRHCLMISEEVPQNWQISVPFILKTLF